jgi:hypothetical protein
MKNYASFLLFMAICASTLFANPGEKYTVSNAKEFVEAIGPQRTIIVEPGEYDLSSVSGMSGEYFSFEEAYDGMELEIAGVTGLKIEGAEKWQSHLITRPQYGHVIRFKGCQGISISNIKAGHGPESGYCTGGVFLFEGCQGIKIEGCHLYGSGTEGLTIMRSQSVSVDETIIKSCTYSIMSLSQSQGITFNKCKFFDNQEFELVNISECDGITYKNCEFDRNRTEYAFFNVESSNNVVLKKCSFDANKASRVCNSVGGITHKGTSYSNNQWFDGK